MVRPDTRPGSVGGRMSPLELRAGLSLASLFALRMLGLFLILPVFSVHAPQLAGGGNPALVGVALGIYGLSQAILQIPYGMASDRYGRKRVIVIGLLLFAAGSFVAAWASDIHMVILGRAMQGAGAISAPVTAFAADLTRDEHRAKAMAMIGASIGVTFAVSLVLAPGLYESIGMDGIFNLAGALSLAAIGMTLFVVPAETRGAGDPVPRARSGALRETLRDADQLRLNFGIFSLHVVQMAIFVVLPAAFVRFGGLAVAEHWKIYLPVVIGSFVLMAPPLIQAERRGRLRVLFLSAIVLLLAVELGFAVCYTNFGMAVVLLLAFFVAFNILEATLPSLVSRTFRRFRGVCIRNRDCRVMVGNGMANAHSGRIRGAGLPGARRDRSGGVARAALALARGARCRDRASTRRRPVNGVS